MQRRSLARRARSLLPLMALAAALLPIFLVRLEDRAIYHADEGMWIPISSMTFERSFVDRDFGSAFWREPYLSWGSHNPQIGKYIIGAGVWLAGYHSTITIPYDSRKTLAENIAYIRQIPIPEAGLLHSARLPVALLGIVSCLLIYWLASMVAGQWCGLLAVASVVGAHLLALSSRRAMIDTPALCLSLLALLALIHTVRSLEAGSRRAIGWAALAGIGCGLALGTKLSGGLMLAVCAAVLLLEALRQARFGSARGLGATIAAGCVIAAWAWVIFFISNPFLFAAPIVGIRHMLTHNAVITAIDTTPIATLPAKAAVIWRSTTIYGPLAQLGLPGDRLLLLAGALGLGHAAWHAPQLFRKRSLHVITIWIAVIYAGTLLWIPQDWGRYYLPLQPCNAFLQAYGAIWIARGVWLSLRNQTAWRRRYSLAPFIRNHL
jgi:hypothetical protein